VTAPNALDHVRPVFRRIITWGAVLAVALAIVGGVVGLLVADTPGLVGGLLGAVLSVVFLGLTAVSVLVALRVSKGQMISGAFFGIVMGTWLLKFIVFIVLLVALKDRTWVDFPVLAIVIIAGVVGSLVIDVVAVAKARIPIGVQLPGDGADGSADAENPTPRN
jgi:drug/metabolite transporter (DMT)-like permease